MDAELRRVERTEPGSARWVTEALRAGRLTCGLCRTTREAALRHDHTTAPVLCPACGGLDPLQRVQLAAYVGDPAAREIATDWCPVNEWTLPIGTRTVLPPEAMPLDRWAQGLTRFGQIACVRVAVAAARVALVRWERTGCGCEAPRRAIEAAAAWLACPCEEHREAWPRATGRVDAETYLWIPSWSSQGQALTVILPHAARLVGEAVVREAIRAALVPWALGVEGGGGCRVGCGPPPTLA